MSSDLWLKQIWLDSSRKKKKKSPGMNHCLHSFPPTNNFIWESCHIVSTVTTNGIVPWTSVSDSHTDTAAGAGHFGLSWSLQIAEPQRNWKWLVRRGFIIGTQENFIITLGSSVSFEILERGYVSTLNHAEDYFWREGRGKKMFLVYYVLGLRSPFNLHKTFSSKLNLNWRAV